MTKREIIHVLTAALIAAVISVSIIAQAPRFTTRE
jgi:hypothetical protein